MFCIYLFSDENGLPVYVGKAKCLKKRIKQHYRDRHKYNSWFYNWLNKQIREDKIFYIDILEEVNSDNWKEKEKYWISHIKQNGYKLKNMTDGGDGNNNQVFTQESAERRRQKLVGRERSEETRNKISKSHKGKKLSETTKKKLSDYNKGKPCSKEVIQLLSKKVNKYSLNGELIKSYNSLTEASLEIGCRKSTLSNVIIRKKVKKYKGFLWNYN
jgi:group I intron endonuclease